MYELKAEATIRGTLDEIWRIQTDVANWPRWNSHERAARLDGPFEAGVRGWSKPKGGPAADWVLTSVEAPTRWASRSALPGGALTGERSFTAVGDGRVRCRYRMCASGPFELLFRLWFGRGILRDMATGFAELEAEVLRRRGAGESA